MNGSLDQSAKGLAQKPLTCRQISRRLGLTFCKWRIISSALITSFAAQSGIAAQWVPFPAMQDARYGFALGALPDGRLIAAGGVSWPVGGGPSTLSSAEMYSPATGSWAFLPTLPVPRENMGAAVGRDGRFYSFGGDSLAGPFNGSTDVQIFDPLLNRWSLGAPMPTQRTYVAAATLPDGRIVAVGGLQASPYGESRAVEAYAPVSDTWTELAPLPDGCQSVSATVGPDGLLYIVGGACTQTTWSSQLLIYNPANNTWTSGTPLPDGRAWAGGAWGADGRLYIVGGYNEPGLIATGYAYERHTTSWSSIDALPGPVYQHGVVATSPHLIVSLGGCGGGGGTSLCPSRDGFALATDGAAFDSDKDGVPDSEDHCPQTPQGAVVDAHGCSIDQLVPCAGTWKNHGAYVAAVAHVAGTFHAAGLITQEQQDAIVSSAARSNCGEK